MIALECPMVSGDTYVGVTPLLFKQVKVITPDLVLCGLIIYNDSWWPFGNLWRQHCFSSVDLEERCLRCALVRGGPVGWENSGKLINPTLAGVLQALVALGLESLEHLCVSPLHLVIAPWVSHRNIPDADADVITVLMEHFALVLWLMVSDNPVQDPIAAYDGLEELHNRFFVDSGHDGCLGPFGELVDGDVQETIDANDPRERAKDIHPLYSKRPGG
jgi:hypothetical protein